MCRLQMQQTRWCRKVPKKFSKYSMDVSKICWEYTKRLKYIQIMFVSGLTDVQKGSYAC